MVRSRGIEPPRAKPTAPSTLRVYQFRHDRVYSARMLCEPPNHVANETLAGKRRSLVC